MKKIILLFSSAIALFFFACNNKTENKADNDEVIADSLFKEVQHGHDVGMVKWMKIKDAQVRTQRLIDSIGKLPGKAQQEAAAYKSELNALLNDLNRAYAGMETWMSEMNWEPDKIEIKQRVKYLTDEKLKMDKMNDALVSGLQKADSVLKIKF